MSARRPRLFLLIALAAAFYMLAAAVVVTQLLPEQDIAPPAQTAAPTPATTTGNVVDEKGEPLPGATVEISGSSTRTDEAGRFAIPLEQPAIATVTAEGALPRTLALEPGRSWTIPLTREAGAVSLRFGGDVMMGRRFYHGEDDKPLLSDPSSVPEHAAVLSAVSPLLKDADVTMVNLETPLTDDPWRDPDLPRPEGMHPDKEYAFTTSTAAAKALADAGVDVVSLANNHVVDALDDGVTSTIAALDAAGIKHFGLGADLDSAWEPAIVEARGQRVAYVGCTTVTGKGREGRPYVAAKDRAGAAPCDVGRLAKAVSSAAQEADTVVVSLHGGRELRREQDDQVRALVRVAQEKGAQVVAGHHPHVVGGFSATPTSLTAESLGNLVFDQHRWETLTSYLLRVDVREGRWVQATTDPLVLDGYRPEPAVGTVRDAISRVAAGTLKGGGRLSGPGTTMGGPATSRQVDTELAGGVIRHLQPGWSVNPDSAPGIRWGTDLLLGTGDLEPYSVAPDEGPGTTLRLGRGSALAADAACTPTGDATGRGVMIARGPGSDRSGYAAQAHRARISPGSSYTVLADVRRADPGSSLEIHWYDRARGDSTDVSRHEIPVGAWDGTDCQHVRLDAVAPPGARYAQVYVVLEPHEDGQVRHRLAVDDLRLIEWTDDPVAGRRYDTVESPRALRIGLVGDDGAGEEPFLP